jgi:hypothetical protein
MYKGSQSVWLRSGGVFEVGSRTGRSVQQGDHVYGLYYLNLGNLTLEEKSSAKGELQGLRGDYHTVA